MNLNDIRKLSCFGYSAFLFSCLFSGKGGQYASKKEPPGLAKKESGGSFDITNTRCFMKKHAQM